MNHLSIFFWISFLFACALAAAITFLVWRADRRRSRRGPVPTLVFVPSKKQLQTWQREREQQSTAARWRS